MFRFKNSGFWLSPEVLEGLGSSGRLVGSISTYPGTCQCPWSRVMTKNPRGNFFSSGYGTRNLVGRKPKMFKPFI